MPRQTSPSLFLAAIVTCSALLTITVLTGLKAIPGWDVSTRGAWAGRANDPWRLRTGDHGAEAPVARMAAAEETTEERRVVRVVYPGLTGSR